MTGHLGIIGNDTVITDDAVVRDMTVSLQQAVVADTCFPAFLCSPVHCHKLSYSGIISYFHQRIFSFKLQVLGNSGDHGAGENAAVPADARPFHNGHIAADPGTFSNFNIVMNDCKRVYFYIGRQLCVGMNIRMGMNHLRLFLMRLIIKACLYIQKTSGFFLTEAKVRKR